MVCEGQGAAERIDSVGSPVALGNSYTLTHEPGHRLDPRSSVFEIPFPKPFGIEQAEKVPVVIRKITEAASASNLNIP